MNEIKAEIGSIEKFRIIDTTPRQHTDQALAALLNQPVRNPVNKAALDKLVQHYTDAAPLDTLEKAHRVQQYDAHNAAIDKKKAKKREIKKLAKDAGISPATLRRMLGRA